MNNSIFRRRNVFALVMTAGLLVAGLRPAFAQTEDSPAAPPAAPATNADQPAAAKKAAPATGITTRKSRASERLKLEFEEDLVEGGLENTELNFIQTRKDNNFKKMIKIRENFIPEVRK